LEYRFPLLPVRHRLGEQPVERGVVEFLFEVAQLVRDDELDATARRPDEIDVQAHAPARRHAAPAPPHGLHAERRQRVPAPSLGVKAMRRRWGSMSPRGRMCLNVDLIRTPRRCIELVVTHELCHLEEKFHDAPFYRLLAEAMPDWKEWKAVLQ